MEAIRLAAAALGAVNLPLTRAGVAVSALLVAAMTVIVIAGVVFRYALNNSITWVEDVSLILMVSVAFLVAPAAYRQGANVAIAMLVETFPRRLGRLLRLVINLLVLWVIWRLFQEASGFLLPEGRKGLVARGWGIRVNTVPIPWGWPYLLVPASLVAMALVGIELVLRDVHALVTGRTELDVAPPAGAPAD